MATITTGGGFREIQARNIASQNQKQRFPHASEGSASNLGISPNDFDSDDDEPQMANPTGPHQPPRISEWRSNLVALSQKDNLYFAAYQEKIHVTIPRGLKQTLSGKPDLILDPPRSKDGIRVGGYIDRANGHYVNHLIVGNLGNLEILLLACDDGDIIAYYTHNIQAAIGSGSERQQEIQPFFHDNVGISAWGLAVHEQSRLIAVSSNNREVVIFAFGCTTGSRPSSIVCDLELSDLSQLDLIDTRDVLFPTITQAQSTDRSNNFRKVLKLGVEGHNIPSIDFSNGSNGEAHSVLATDIVGNLWILDIWGDEVKRMPTIQKVPTRGNSVMGWGALLLPLAAFQRTSTPEEALNVANFKSVAQRTPLGVTTLGKHFDITPTIHVIKDCSKYHPSFGYGINGPVNATTPALVADGLPPRPPESAERMDPWEFFWPPGSKGLTPAERHDHSRRFFVEFINEVGSKGAHLESLRRLPGFDNPMTKDAEKALAEAESNMVEEDEVEEKELVYHLQDKCAILRTYQEDIELISPTETMPRSICRRVLKQTLPNAVGHLAHFERLILHFLIVELSLVIVGSQIGRVALVSLTRPEDSFSNHGPITMFRVDRILPTKQHEDAAMRPHVPLLGIAVSPLQGQQMKERKRWRLIMHYYDHSILSYEIGREGGELLVL